MTISISTLGLWKTMRVVALGSVLVFALQACKKPGAVESEDELKATELAANEPDIPADPEPVDKAEMVGADSPEPPQEDENFLQPLTSAPWLGHADDGVLVKVEFFAKIEGGATLCRTTVKDASGRSANTKSPFSASSELGKIIWEDGKSRGSYDADAKVVEASVTSKIGEHRVKLRQVTVESHPELAAARTSIPDDEDSQVVHQKFADRLESGASWWKSVDEWDKLVTPEALAADGNYAALIRPAGNDPIKLPEIEPGGNFSIPLIAHLPPGMTLAKKDQTLGVMAELHQGDRVRSMWSLVTLSPGALTQDVSAHWAGDKSESAWNGAATVYIYLCKTGGGGRMAMTNQPASNLLKIDLEIGGEQKEADTAE